MKIKLGDIASRCLIRGVKVGFRAFIVSAQVRWKSVSYYVGIYPWRRKHRYPFIAWLAGRTSELDFL